MNGRSSKHNKAYDEPHESRYDEIPDSYRRRPRSRAVKFNSSASDTDGLCRKKIGFLNSLWKEQPATPPSTTYGTSVSSTPKKPGCN